MRIGIRTSDRIQDGVRTAEKGVACGKTGEHLEQALNSVTARRMKV
ncbi:hypothetical protein ACFL0Q_03885 [Thermodesulfobacteriota bacterium]